MVAKRIVIIFGGFFWAYFLWGIFGALSCLADPMLRSEISPELGSLDDLYLFTVTLDDYQDRVNPQLSTSADFSVELLGPKTSISIINGAVRSQQAFVYQLTPKRSGNLKTPEAQVEVFGKILSAPPINVSISPMANTQPTDPQAGTTNPPPNQQLFMTQTASPESVYVGQQIVNSIGVFTQVNLKGVRINDDTSDGFWQETISDGQNGQRELNGKEYATIHISRALFPLRPGTLVIPARQGIAQVPVTRQSNPLSGFDPFSADFFDNFFQRTVVQERKMQSNEVTIDAIALPAPPADIKHFIHGLTIVGNTSLSLEYSDTPLKVGESKNITLRIISEGHLNPLKFLPLAPPTGVKVYEGQSLVRHNTHGGKLITEKTFTYSIVPVRSGMLRIPGAALAYFDPDEKKYRVASSKDIVIVSSGSSSLPENPGDNNHPEQIDNSSRDTMIASPIPTLPPVAIAPPLAYSELTLWDRIRNRISFQLSLLVIGTTLALAAFTFMALRGRAANLPIKMQLDAWNKATDSGDLEHQLREWLVSVIPSARAAATFDELRSLIVRHAPNTELSLSLVTLIDDLEVARFSGESSTSIENLKNRGVNIIRKWPSPKRLR